MTTLGSRSRIEVYHGFHATNSLLTACEIELTKTPKGHATTDRESKIDCPVCVVRPKDLNILAGFFSVPRKRSR